MTEPNTKRIDAIAQLGKAKDALMAKVRALRAELPALLVEKPKPSTWVGLAERAKIIRLHQMGYRAADISGVTGRSSTTVCRVIRRYQKGLTKQSD